MKKITLVLLISVLFIEIAGCGYDCCSSNKKTTDGMNKVSSHERSTPKEI